MKKKLLAIVLTAALTISVTACGAKTPDSTKDITSSSAVEATSAEASTEISTETSETGEPELNEPWYDEYFWMYYSVIQDFYNMAYLEIEPLNEQFYQPQGDTMWMDEAEKAKLGFYFEDINGEGSPEMIIGRGDTIHAVCGMAGDGPFVYVGAGYRSMMNIYENGLIVYEGSSGASCYSYNFYYIDGQYANLQDFFYTDYDETTNFVLCYHNTTGLWDNNPDDVVSEDEFNVMTEVGLEARNYSDKWILMSEYKGVLANTSSGVTPEELAEEGVTWSLTDMVYADNHLFADHEGIIQTLNFDEDGNAYFYRSDSDGEIRIDKVEGTFNIGETDQAYYTLKMPDTTYQSLYVIGFTTDGALMTQRMYYDYLTGASFVVNEYYTKSFG